MVVRGLPSGTCWDDETNTQRPLPGMPTVGVSDQGILNQLVNLCCVFLILDGDTKRHKAYTGSGNWCPTSSLRDRSCIPCTEMLVVGGYKQGKRGGLVPGLFVVRRGLLEMLISSRGGARVFVRVFMREFVA